jgi:type I restriction enzyme S subunit
MAMIDYNQKYTLGELENLNIIKLGRGNVISKNDIRNNPGKYPIYSSSAINNGKMGEYGGYMFDDERITWSIDGGGKFFYRNNHKYSVTNVSGWLKVINSDILNTKFLYYLLLNEWSFKKYDYTNKAHPSVIRDDYILHIPSIDVQNEIVEVLDKFTELEAELEARTKQYEYYRNLLLTFDDDVPMKPLSEVCVLSAGGDVPKRHFSKEKTNEYKVPIYSNGIGDNALYGWTNEARINNPCITIAARGTIGYVALRNEPFVPVVRLICAIPKECINVSYLKYATETLNFKVPTSGIPQLTVPMIGKYNIPVPPLEEQKRIVSILDKFSSLVNDIKEGLPAEIELRRKQYEYYRNKLLTFE